MVGWFKKLFGRAPKESTHTVSIDALDPFSQRVYEQYAGDKYPTSYGDTVEYEIDYWELRARSRQLFTSNKYAKGIIRRLLTNEINTGIMVKSTPEESIIGLEDDSLIEWSEDVENRFRLWGNNAQLVDYVGRKTWGSIQQAVRMESLISGDALVVLRQDKVTKLPNIQLVSGDRVRTPAGKKPLNGNKIVEGVEINKSGRHVAFWHQSDPDPETGQIEETRIPAWVNTNGSLRRNAWLVYGTEKLVDEVRGQPLLSVMLQSLREIDRYKDATLRKATVNSILAMFIKKNETKAGTLPITGAAARRNEATVTDGDGSTRNFKMAQFIPGAVIEELQVGEEPTVHSTSGTDVNFGTFEAAVLSAIAWSLEIPSEILILSFNANYSASQAALNEFKMYLNKVRKLLGDTFYQPLYIEWLLSSVLTGKIQASGLINAWRDPSQYDVFGAWVSAQWNGAIKPSTDLAKLVKGYQGMIDMGAITRHQTSQELSGTSFIQNAKQLERENTLLAQAMRPLLELKKEFGEQMVDDAIEALGKSVDSVQMQIDDIVEESN